MTCRILLVLEQRLNFSWRSNLTFLGLHTYIWNQELIDSILLCTKVSCESMGNQGLTGVDRLIYLFALLNRVDILSIHISYKLSYRSDY